MLRNRLSTCPGGCSLELYRCSHSRCFPPQGLAMGDILPGGSARDAGGRLTLDWLAAYRECAWSKGFHIKHAHCTNSLVQFTESSAHASPCHPVLLQHLLLCWHS